MDAYFLITQNVNDAQPTISVRIEQRVPVIGLNPAMEIKAAMVVAKQVLEKIKTDVSAQIQAEQG